MGFPSGHGYGSILCRDILGRQMLVAEGLGQGNVEMGGEWVSEKTPVCYFICI